MAEIDSWMPWHLAEYLADTMHLSTLEHGAYLLLLAHGWRNDGLIVANEQSLAGITRLTVEQWRAIQPTLERFFTKSDHPALGPVWFQKRQVTEIRKAKEQKAKAAERTKNATAARWSSVTDSSRTPHGERNDSHRAGKGEDSSSLGNSNSAGARVDAPALSAKDEFWAPLCRIFGLEPKTIADEQRLWQQCVDFRTKGATVAEVERRAGNYRLHFTTAFTPKALLSNWEICKEPPAPKLAPNERPRPTRPRITA